MNAKKTGLIKGLILWAFGICILGNLFSDKEVRAVESTFQNNQVIFADDFSNPSTDWEVTKSAAYNSYYIDGEYAIDIFKPADVWNYTSKLDIPTVYYSVQADIHFLKSKNGMYGLFINQSKDEKYYYQFVVNPDTKCYVLVKRGKNYYEPLINWTESNVIKSDKSTNTLRIEVWGSVIKLFINGQYVNELKADGIGEQRKAGVVGATLGDAVSIRYDNFIVTKLDGISQSNAREKTNTEQKTQYVLVEGNLEGSVEKEAFKTIEDSIEFMDKLWGIQLSKPVQIYMYRTRLGYKEGLIKVCNLPEQVAEESSKNTIAVASYYNILVNKRALILNKAGRNTMCHETIHVFQHDAYFTGRKAAPLRCFMEGYAYLASEIFLGEWEGYKKDAEAWLAFIVQQLGTDLPDLTRIRTSKQYDETMESFGVDNFKRYMAVAMGFLLERAGGHKAFYTYFSGGPADSPKEEAFERSFGMKPEEFKAQFSQYLTELAARK